MSATTALAGPRSTSRSTGLRPRAPRPTRPAPAAPASVQLTRRGRLTLVALIAAVAFVAISAGQAALGLFDAQAGSAGADGSATSSGAARTWVVQPGETLWSIAERLDPNTDPRETVARIVSMNDLPTSAVAVGEEIFVPA